MKKIFLAVFSLVMLSAACKKENDPAPPPEENNVIRTGTQSVYIFSNINELGEVTYSEIDTFTVQEQTIEGSQWFVVINPDAQPIYAWQKRNDGWWLIEFPNPAPSLFVKIPAAVNDYYLHNTWDYKTDTAKVVALNVTVDALGVSYPGCMHVALFDIINRVADYYFLPEQLLIKNNIYKRSSITGNMFIASVIELKSYTY